MQKYILKRVVMMLPVLLGVVLIVFSMLYFSPGRTADYMLGDDATEEDKLQFEKEQGLDRPFLIQYANYIYNVLRGDMGVSWLTKRPVFGELVSRFPNTLKISILSVTFATIIGVSLGVISATKQYSFWDNLVRVISIVGVSMPSFWEGLMLIILFSVVLEALPASGFTTWKHWILPTVTIGTASAATIMRMTRSSMLEAIRQDYIRTARAKGQSERLVIWRHAFRNALIPIITTIGLMLGRTIGGIAINETVFSIPGIGKYIVEAIPKRDAPIAQGGILLVAFAMSFVNLLTDIVYSYVDPRIRSQYMRRKDRAGKGGV